MKKYIYLFHFLPLALFAQDRPELAAALIPAEIAEGADAVIRHERTEFKVSAPGRATKDFVRTVTLFNEKSDYNYIVVHYGPSNKLGKIKGRIYDASGNHVRDLHKNEIRDVSAISGFSIYEDDRVRYLEVNRGEYPYTVEFEYSLTYKDVLTYPDWRVSEFSTGLENADFVIELPVGLGLNFEAQNLSIEPTIKTAGDHQVYHWEIGPIPPVKKEPYSPPSSEILPSIRVSPHRFEAEGYEGSMANWAAFGQFMNKLAEGRDVLSPEMKKTVAELTADAPSEQEKINRLYRYIQKNMRYVSVQLGIGGWQPFDAGYVESNKYGDCKALSNFMRAMLKEAGITSYPVLIKAGNLNYEINEDFACSAFNHYMVYVPSENYWLECTSATAPPNYVGSWTADRNVLLVTEEGGVVARTPTLTSERNTEQNDLRIDLTEDGAAKLAMTSTRTGEKQEYYRYAANELSEEELRKRFQKGVPLPSFELGELSVVLDADLPEAKIVCTAEVKRFASKAGKRLFVPLNPMNTFSDIPDEMTERTHPIVRTESYSETDHIVLALPAGYDAESYPMEPIKIESEHAEYSLEVKVENDQITILRSLKILPCRLPAEEYGAWREVYKQIAKADGAKLVLVEREP